jgi:polyphenol oxidase
MADCLVPAWPAPVNVRALQTIRTGGTSQAPWNSLNLGDHVGDLPANVVANRASLRALLPAEPLWLKQVHGIAAVNAEFAANSPEADAIYTHQPDKVCVVMTADCLPVLFCNKAGTVVAAAHAGWRGLLAGVLEATIVKMGVPASDLLVWLGPAIGPHQFEVGNEVHRAFVECDPIASNCFAQLGGGKWLADIYGLARQRLQMAGVASISGGDFCTFSDPLRFFSYRRDGVTGRMASLIWLDDQSGV